MANRNYQDYLAALARRESGGQPDPYRAVNRAGYLGKYQMGELALIDAGFYKRDGTNSNDFRGEWTGKHGVHSKEDFLNSPQAQEAAVHAYNRAQWRYIRNEKLDTHIGKQYGDGPMLTASGLLAGAHLVGVGNLQKYLESEGKTVPRDGNKVPITRYMQDMAGYEVPFHRPRQDKAAPTQRGEVSQPVQPSAEEAKQAQAPARLGKSRPAEANPGQAVLDYALKHFSKGYEYGRPDEKFSNRSPNSTTDRSRDGRDLDGDGLKGIDCSALVHKALRGAGFQIPGATITTGKLFSKGGGTTPLAEKYFDVLSPGQGRAGQYEPGDILMFASRKNDGRHVGIFQGYDAKGRMQFFGSQVTSGPATETIRPGGAWDGNKTIFLGALRPKAEHFRSHKALATRSDIAEDASLRIQSAASETVGHPPAKAAKPATAAAPSGKPINADGAAQDDVTAFLSRKQPSGTGLQSHAPKADAIEVLWNLRYRHMGMDSVPDPVRQLSQKVQCVCQGLDANQNARVTTYLAERAEKAQLPLQAIGEVLRESHGGRDLLHAVHMDRSRVASADINKALQAALEPALSLHQPAQSHVPHLAARPAH